MSEQIQRQYELTCILSPHIEGDDLDKAKKEIQELISKLGGEIEFKEEKKQNLAYPISKEGQAIFLIGQLSIIPENITNISKELKLNKKVLRHLLRQISEIKTKPEKPKEKKPAPPKSESFDEKPEKEEKKPEKKQPKDEKPKEKMDLQEIDKKLDEIIDEI